MYVSHFGSFQANACSRHCGGETWHYLHEREAISISQGHYFAMIGPWRIDNWEKKKITFENHVLNYFQKCAPFTRIWKWFLRAEIDPLSGNYTFNCSFWWNKNSRQNLIFREPQKRKKAAKNFQMAFPPTSIFLGGKNEERRFN